MPGLVRGAVAGGTLPFSLSTKFTESHAVQLNWNEYQDGTTQRTSLVTRGRRNWKLAKRLAPGDLAKLETFWESNPGTAFYFYNPPETDPPFSQTPTGSAGRYLVRFTSNWEPSFGMARADVSCDLIEVASDADLVGTPVIPPIPPTALVTAAGLGMTTSFQVINNTNVAGVIATIHLASDGNDEFFTSSDNYSASGQSYFLPQSVVDSMLVSGTYTATVFVDNPLGGFQPPGVGPAVAQIYDVYLDVTHQDGTTTRLRPTSTSMSATGGFGAITNPGNAIDGDPSTFATLTRSSFDSLDFYNTFSLHFSGIR